MREVREVREVRGVRGVREVREVRGVRGVREVREVRGVRALIAVTAQPTLHPPATHQLPHQLSSISVLSSSVRHAFETLVTYVSPEPIPVE